MMTRILKRVLAGTLAACGIMAWGCAGHAANPGAAAGRGSEQFNGHLLIIGGGLDDDNKPVYGRLIELARKNAGGAVPRLVIATAASGDQDANAKGKTESIHAYCPECEVQVIRRETPEAEAVAMIDRAQAMFFTGGDQKRITTVYRPDGKDTPAATAMRRLLSRGGVIAGTSAGDAMMSDPMFFTGRSAEALGIASTRTEKGSDDDADAAKKPTMGPQIGKGMGFFPWGITDSHFFERHRFGRLVAALEASGTRLGIGVGEDACVEVDLKTGELIGISVADALLVDVRGLTRSGLTRDNIRATVIHQGRVVSLPEQLGKDVSPATPLPLLTREHALVEPGQNRQLVSWRFFVEAQGEDRTTAHHLALDGYEQLAWSDGHGWSIVRISPAAHGK
jgi:hypothetical protein